MDSFWNEIGKYMVLWFGGIFILLMIVAYYSSCRNADIYNRQNNTSYSCGDFFWASSQINSQTQTIKIK